MPHTTTRILLWTFFILGIASIIPPVGLAEDFQDHLSLNLGVRPLFAVNAGQYINGLSYSDECFIGPGISGFGDIYFDNKYGFELGYGTVFQNKVPASATTDVSILSFILKMRPSRDVEVGIGGGNFSWDMPGTPPAKQRLQPDGPKGSVSATGLILHAGMPLKIFNKIAMSLTTQGFFIPEDKKEMYGVIVGIGFGYNLYKGKAVPALKTGGTKPERNSTAPAGESFWK